MTLTTLTFVLYLHRLESLLRQDYARLSVRKRDMYLLMALSFLLKLNWLLNVASGVATFIGLLSEALIRACICCLPFFILYRLRAALGSADLKFAALCGFLLPLFDALCALLLACLWAAFNELCKGRSRERFAFLPYLGLSTLPFIVKQVLAGGS